MAKKKSPIDPLDGPKMAPAGDIGAMDDALNVTRDGRLYVDKGAIVAIKRATDPVRSGFENVSVLNSALEYSASSPMLPWRSFQGLIAFRL
jgi:hypothetical protein